MKLSILIILVLYSSNFSMKIIERDEKNVFDNEIISLPPPQTVGGMPLFEALNKRRSQRDFIADKSLSLEQLSQSLWSCIGVNRLNLLRTTPSAKAWFPFIVYVFIKDGVFKYDPIKHELERILTGDYREYTGTQGFVKDASVNFVLAADVNKPGPLGNDLAHRLRSIYLDSGHCLHSIALYAASEGLKGVPRGMFIEEPLLDLLKLDKESNMIAITFSLGY